MRVVMTGGGSGGHIYPAIAIADRIRERSNDAEIIFVGSEIGLEKDIVPRNDYHIEFVTVGALHRKDVLQNFKSVFDYMKGKKEAKRILEKFKPDLVIGTGGFVSAPVIKAASKMGITCYIHEQNATPGVANKILEKNVKSVFLGFDEAREHFKQQEKLIFSGNPVRDSFFKARKNTSRDKLNIGYEEFVIMSFGGSQGAARLNKAMIDVAKKYSGVKNTRVVFVTGDAYYEPIMTEIREMKLELCENIEIKPYIDNMELYVSSADVVISRSGALAVSEIAVCGTPSILIPLPNSAGNHQMFNAKAISDRGGAVLLEEKNLSGTALLGELIALQDDVKKREEMAVKAKSCAPLDASDIIYYNILNG